MLSKAASREIDSKDTKARIGEAAEDLETCFDIVINSMKEILGNGFSIEEYNRIKTDSLLADRTKRSSRKLKKVERKQDEPGCVNEELRERLQEWRSGRFKKDNVPAYTIMHQSTLMDIAALVPKTKAELMRIKGFGTTKFEKYGEEILKITSEF